MFFVCSLYKVTTIIFIFLVGFFESNVSSQIIPYTDSDYPVALDGSTVDFQLKNYNVSDPDGESIEKTYELLPMSTIQINVSDIPYNVQFMLVQVHSYLRNVTLSYNKVLTPSTSVSGTNIGLISNVTASNCIFYLTYDSYNVNTSVMIAVQAYGVHTPVPGGCNMEFQVETSPFLLISYNRAVIDVSFAPASPPQSLNAWLGIEEDHSCDQKPSPVQHLMYHMYLPERDFSKDMYFSGLRSMMTMGRIRTSGIVSREKIGAPSTRHLFAAYFGVGNVFVITAQTGTYSSVYVPSFTYACNPSEENNTCQVLTTTFSKVLWAVTFFLGIFACFAGHRFFKTQMFLLGFLAGGLVCYVIADGLTTASEVILSTSVASGFVMGCIILTIWCCCGVPVMSIVLATLTLGYVIASVIFYPVVDAFDFLASDVNYWALFCSIIILAPIFMISLSEKANIISCSVLGAYAAIVPIDHYIGSNLRYIVINTIRRATVDNFAYATIDAPFQTKDLILSLSWIILAALGIGIQLLLVRGKAPFPAPSSPLQTLQTLQRSLRGPSPPNERTPLLLPPKDSERVVTDFSYSYDRDG